MTVSPRSIALPADGGSAGVAVTTAGSCVYAPVTAAGWLQLSSGPTGAVGFLIQAGANTTGAPRTAIVDVAGFIVIVTQPAAVQNLVVNGGFETSTSGWLQNFSTGTGSAAWANGSVVASPGGSGFALLTSTQPRAGYQLHQCVNVKPSTTYETGVTVRVPSGQDSAATTIFGIYEVPVADCTDTGFIQSRQLNFKSPPDIWTPLTTNYTTTSRAGSLIIAIAVGGANTPPFSAWFDDVYVREKR